MRNLGISPLSRRLVYHTLSLPHASQQVLGPDLNRSESTCLLMTQGFSPLGVPNSRSQRTLRNKSFFAASVPTRTNRERSSLLLRWRCCRD
jgi:hypothetical protein